MDSGAILRDLQPLTIFLLFFSLPLLFLMFILPRKRAYPPGPKGLPIVGNMLMLDQLTHHGLDKLAKIYGGLFHLKIGVLHMVVVSSPDMACEVLQAQDAIFSNRPITEAINYLTFDRADMVFANYSQFWKQMRKICVVKLFSRKRAESWASVREEVESMIQPIMAQTGSLVNIRELVFGVTRKITYRAAFGSNFIKGQDEFISTIQEFTKLIFAFNVADFIPWLGWIQSKNFKKKLKEVRKSLEEVIDKIIDDHLQKRKNQIGSHPMKEVDADMVDELLSFYEKDGEKTQADDFQSSIRFTRDHIKGIILDIMVGGTETISTTTEWTMVELMKNPQELQRVQQELEVVEGLDNMVQETHLDKLVYLKSVIKETLRLHPPIPLYLHENEKAATVGGYFIPAWSRVVINAWAIGQDPTTWENPDTFDPSRFMKEGAPDFNGSDFEFIPFGSGRRSCPGMQLGLYALELVVANLCHCFTRELPDGMTPSDINMEDVFGLIAPKANKLVASPNYRLACKMSLTSN